MSPNGIGNKVLALTMSFHLALMQGRAFVVTDWPPAQGWWTNVRTVLAR